jgi:hypothetical protein
VSGDKLRDVVFFDESIDAKMNRYMFKLHNIDTPFLLDTTDKHAKTYVPPTPNADGLPAPRPPPPPASGSGRFCRLDPALFSAPRKLPASLDAGLTLASAYQLRLKRNNKQQLPMPPATAPPPHDHDGSHLSALGCTYSCYLVTVALLVCHSLAKGPASRRHAAPTTQRIIEEYAPSAPGSSNNSVAGSAVGESPVGRERRPSTASSTGQPRSRSSSSAAAGTEELLCRVPEGAPPPLAPLFTAPAASCHAPPQGDRHRLVRLPPPFEPVLFHPLFPVAAPAVQACWWAWSAWWATKSATSPASPASSWTRPWTTTTR